MKSTSPAVVVCVLGLILSAIVSAHAAVEVNDRTDVSLEVFVACAADGAGEIVDLTGPLHTIITFTINDNNVSGFFRFQPQGISGTGETTGEKYRGTGVTQESFKTSLQNGQANLTFVNNFRIIGQKAGNNFLVHETSHFTIDANGTVTVSHDNFSVDCK